MKKSKAFTLTELLVVMVISAIVVSLAFLALTMIKKQTFLLQRNLTHKQTIKTLEKKLWGDFNTLGLVNADGDVLTILKNKDTVSYKILESYIIRNNDSFPITIKKKLFFLDGTPVKNGFIDAIKLEFNTKSIFVFGQKDAAFYLNN